MKHSWEVINFLPRNSNIKPLRLCVLSSNSKIYLRGSNISFYTGTGFYDRFKIRFNMQRAGRRVGKELKINERWVDDESFPRHWTNVRKSKAKTISRRQTDWPEKYSCAGFGDWSLSEDRRWFTAGGAQVSVDCEGGSHCFGVVVVSMDIYI